MNVLVVTAQKPDSTGSGVYVAETVRGMVGAGHTVALVCGIDRNDDPAPTLPADVRLFPVRFRTPGLPFLVCGMSDEMPYEATRYRDLTPSMTAHFVAAFERALEAACNPARGGIAPDVVVCHHLYLATALVAHRFARMRGTVRTCAVCHSTDLRQMRTHGLEREFIIEGIRELDRIYALHEAQAHEIVELYGVPEERVVVVGAGYNARVFTREGADTAEGAPTAATAPSATNAATPSVAAAGASQGAPLRIAYAGKIWRKKGVESLIRALNLLAVRPGSLEVVLAGGHNSQAEYDRIAALAAASPHHIVFAGKLSQLDLAALYRSADVFVLPSFFEGLPLVVIEAIACGCRAVVTDLPGIRPWISANLPHAPVSYVKPPRMQHVDEPRPEDLPALEQHLAQALDEALRAPRPKASALDGLDRLSWDALAERLLALV